MSRYGVSYGASLLNYADFFGSNSRKTINPYCRIKGGRKSMYQDKELTETEHEFVQAFIESLPPYIARKQIEKCLGGVIANQSLSNADATGDGPEIAYKVGRNVVYNTETLLVWIARRYGVEKIHKIQKRLKKA